MTFKPKKSLITCFKNFSILYGKTNDIFKHKKTKNDILKLNISDNNTNISEVNYNLNFKKFLKLKDNSLLSLPELFAVLNKKQFLRILKQEMIRNDEFQKIHLPISFFYSEKEEVSFKLNFKMNFLIKLNNLIGKNLTRYNNNKKYLLYKIFPKIDNNLKEVKEYGKSLFFLSKIFLIPPSHDSSMKTFQKIDLMNLRNDSKNSVKWFYPTGFIFKCSLIYILIPSHICNHLDFRNKFQKMLKFVLAQSIFFKSICYSTLFYLEYHKKIGKSNRVFNKNTLNCLKNYLKKKNGASALKNNFPFRISIGRISNQIVNMFYKYIHEKFLDSITSCLKKKKKRIIPIFYNIHPHKIPFKKIKFKIKDFLEKFNDNEFFDKLIDNFFFKKNEHQFFFFNLKFFIIRKKTFLFLKKIFLSNKRYYFNLAFLLLKLDNNKKSLEIGIISPKNSVGSEINIGICNYDTLKNLISFRIKSKWQFFQINFSSKSVEELNVNPAGSLIVFLENYKINLNIVTNYFSFPVEFSLRKVQSSVIYLKRRFSNNTLEINFYFNIYLKSKIAYILFIFYHSNHSKVRSLNVFSIFRKLRSLKFIFIKNFIHSIIIGLVFFIRWDVGVKDFPRLILIKSLNEKFKENNRFLDKINLEYNSITYRFG